MSVMAKTEAVFCRSAPWRAFARRVVLPWVGTDDMGTEVLEIGGGSGAMAFELLSRRPDITLTVADMDPSMVAAAATRLAPFGERASTTVADATHLDFSDESFDTVCSWLMLHHTIEWQQVLSEVSRVTRPGGSITGYDLANTGIARAIHKADGSEHQLIEPEALESELVGLGLHEVRVESALGGLVMRFAGHRPQD